MVQSTRNAPPCPFEKVFPSQLVRDDAFYMQLAYNQAIEAWKVDEVPIGAVIELGGEVIASAHNQRDSTGDPTAHAEIIALGQAAKAIGDWRLNEATSHWRTLPFKCSIRLPMLFEASLGRHQICSSVSDSTHPRRRGQYCSISFLREKSRNSVLTFASVSVMGNMIPFVDFLHK